jgi:hypothetical protein
MGFKVIFLKAITAYIMVLGIIAQSVNAVGAPCPMLVNLDQSTIGSQYTRMDHSNMDHSNIESPCHSKKDDNCCGEGNCPMNNATSGLISFHPIILKASVSHSIKTAETLDLILSKKTSSLYRPPISAYTL